MNSNYFYQCSTCQYKYQIARMWISRVLCHRLFILFLTISFVILLIIILSLFTQVLFLVIGTQLSRGVFILSRKIVWYMILLIGFITLVCTLFSENANVDVDIAGILNTLATNFYYASQAFSLTGFGIFFVRVYKKINRKMLEWMHIFGDRIP